MMNALVMQDTLQFRQVETPVRAPGELLIRPILTGITPWDLDIQHGLIGFTGIPGSEFVGRVLEADEPELLGKQVVGHPWIGCGVCAWCAAGRPASCPRKKELGRYEYPGVFAELFRLPRQNITLVPEDLDPLQAIFARGLADLLEQNQRVCPQQGMRILVIGDTTTGFLSALYYNHLGFQVTMFGQLLEHLDVLEGTSVHLVRNLNQDEWFDLVVVTRGDSDGIQMALEHVAPEGHIILNTESQEPVPFSLQSLVTRSARIMTARSSSYAHAVKILSEWSLRLDSLITSVYLFERSLDAFDRARRQESLKIIMKY